MQSGYCRSGFQQPCLFFSRNAEKPRRFWILFGIAAILLCVPVTLPGAYGADTGPDAILGLWYTADRDARFEIYKCGDEYCGRMSWMEEPNLPSGQPKLDEHNPEPALRTRPLLGLVLMRGFRHDGDNSWNGRIYSPEDGNTYKCRLSLADENHLKLRGYIGIPLFGRTETWSR